MKQEFRRPEDWHPTDPLMRAADVALRRAAFNAQELARRVDLPRYQRKCAEAESTRCQLQDRADNGKEG
jgi:hypothetical protein